MYLNSDKLKGFYFAEFVYRGGYVPKTLAINEGPLCTYSI